MHSIITHTCTRIILMWFLELVRIRINVMDEFTKLALLVIERYIKIYLFMIDNDYN